MTSSIETNTAYAVAQALHISKAIPAPLMVYEGTAEFTIGPAAAMIQSLDTDTGIWVYFTVFDPTAPDPSFMLLRNYWQHHKLSESVTRAATLVEFFRHYTFH